MTIETSARISVPANAFVGDVPLVAVMRGGFVGSLHRGSVAVADAAGHSILSVGNADEPVFLRSAAKPFQAMPAILSGAIERFGINDEELAAMCASHSGEPVHTHAILSVLAKIGLTESALRCGTHPPLNERTAHELWKSGLQPTPVCNNCSGAHAGMLVACVAQGWPVDGYGLPDHPLQRLTREIVAAFADAEPRAVESATDNCAVPTFRLSLRHAAQAFARLVTGEGLAPGHAQAARRVVAAMTAHPYVIGGQGRFDTDLMQAAQGSILSKGGAEGFQGLGLLAPGYGIAMKITDGNARAIPPIVMRLLDHLGVLDQEARQELQGYLEPVQCSLQDQVVGEIVPVFDLGDHLA